MPSAVITSAGFREENSERSHSNKFHKRSLSLPKGSREEIILTRTYPTDDAVRLFFLEVCSISPILNTDSGAGQQIQNFA
ncbi:MAG: hypothetical protein DRI57_26305 [Deltaproteobacteria bacterium]|nr:MAG: hypothetical protein DRI57_26305 [Deltaproteobacteria bacterium]